MPEANTLLERAVGAHRKGDLEESLRCYRRALQLDPECAQAWNNLGVALQQLGEYDEAVRCLHRAVRIRPDYADACNNLGNTLKRQGRYREALPPILEALRLAPRFAIAYVNLGTTLVELGHFAEALLAFDAAAELEPGNAAALYNRSLVHLLKGDFEQGWNGYEHRWEAMGIPGPGFHQPLWRGEDLRGARILLYAEQGLGDAIQFVRYVPLVAARGARVMLECPARLRPLFSPLALEPLSPAFDYYAPLLSLPKAFGTGLETIPASVPYLHAPAGRTAKWRRRLATAGGLKVGLAWAGSPTHSGDRHRSMDARLLAPLLQIPGVTFFSLQKGAPSPAPNVGVLEDDTTDLLDTAAILAELDLLISVDTMVAHLAGALGRPVWNLLPFSPDWRWMLERTDTPWYPTMRLFRQRALGEWAGVIEQVAAELRTLAGRVETPAERVNRAARLLDSGTAAEAEALCRGVIGAHPELPEAHANLALALEQQSRLEEAATAYGAALRLRPRDARLVNNLGVVLEGLGRFDDAFECFEAALRLDPQFARAHLNRAMAWLAEGNWSRGFEELAWRRRAGIPQPALPAGPAWEGGPLAGQRLLLLSELGLGDTIQFIRYAAPAKAAGARVIVECQPRLAELLKAAEGVDEIVTQRGAPCDLHATLLSLPRFFKEIPARSPYLAVDAERIARWRARVESARRPGTAAVGLVWHTSSGHEGAERRSLPPRYLDRLAGARNVTWVSLQREPEAQRGEGGRFVNFEDPGNTVSDTAAMLCSLDLVVSIDTMAAHLAGALARPVWTLLPFPADWRWLRRGETCPWYPTMRLLRQGRRGDWSGVLDLLLEALSHEFPS